MMNRSRSHSVYHSFFIKLSEHIKIALRPLHFGSILA